jgi:hypothetical protein
MCFDYQSCMTWSWDRHRVISPAEHDACTDQSMNFGTLAMVLYARLISYVLFFISVLEMPVL